MKIQFYQKIQKKNKSKKYFDNDINYNEKAKKATLLKKKRKKRER